MSWDDSLALLSSKLSTLKLQALALPRELSVVWTEFKKEYAKWMALVHKAAVGVHFLEAIGEGFRAVRPSRTLH